MKRTAFTAVSIAAVLIAVSCSKEESTVSKDFEPMVIDAVSESIGTKAQTEHIYDLLWQNKDQILVTDGKVSDGFTLSEGAGTVKGKFVQDNEVSFAGEVEAFYPSTLVLGEKLEWPSTQTKNLVVPMYSKGTLGRSGSTGFSFSSLGSILEIALTTEINDVTVKSISVRDGEKNMSRTFTLNEDGLPEFPSTTRNSITLDLEDGEPIGITPKTFFIAVPAADYRKLKITVKTTDGRMTYFTGGHLDLTGNKVGLISLNAKDFKSGNLLPGRYTVNAEGKTVMFTKANLLYDGEGFCFYQKQIDSPASYNPSEVAHFFWSNDYNKSVGEYLPQDSSKSTNDILFTNATPTTPNPDLTVSGVSGRYRTLSADEWDYLLGNNEKRAGRWATGMIMHCQGIVIVPDDYCGDVPAVISNELSLQNAEEDGVVFLPRGGYRDSYKNIKYRDGDGSYSRGMYWASCPDSTNNGNAFCLYFESFGVIKPKEITTREHGCSIRLVMD